MNLKEFFILLIICLIWGLHFTILKVTVGQTVDPLFYAALRMTCVSILLLPWLKWHKGDMRNICIAGLGFGALNYAFMFPALQYTTASAAAITIELYVPFAIILSIIVLGERIGIKRSAGIALAFAGVVVVGLSKQPEDGQSLFLFGILLMMGAAMAEAIGAVTVKLIKNVSAIELLAWFAVVGTVVLWPLSLTLEDNQLDALSEDKRKPFLLALAYTVILVSIVAHGSYYWLLQRLPIYMVSTGGLMTTLVAVTSSIVILNEPPTVPLFVGGAMTLTGVAIIFWRQKVKASPINIASNDLKAAAEDTSKDMPQT